MLRKVGYIVLIFIVVILVIFIYKYFTFNYLLLCNNFNSCIYSEVFDENTQEETIYSISNEDFYVVTQGINKNNEFYEMELYYDVISHRLVLDYAHLKDNNGDYYDLDIPPEQDRLVKQVMREAERYYRRQIIYFSFTLEPK